MIKRIISILTALVLMAGLVTTTGFADCTELSGSCGDSSNWFINTDDVLVISGTGSTGGRQPWASYAEGVKQVLIEEGITSLSNSDFYNCKNASEIIFPSTIEVLGTCMSSSNLEKLEDIWIFSENVQNSNLAGNGASYPKPGSGVKWHIYAGSTTETSLRDGLKLTDDDFEYITDSEKIPEVTNRASIILPETTETSGPCGLHSTWSWDESTKTLTFSGSGSITISSDFQELANKIENVEMKDSEITSICDCAFGRINPYGTQSALCPGLKSVTFPSTLKTIGAAAFSQTALDEENIQFPEGLEYIGQQAFYKTSLSGALNLPSTMKYIGQQAFDSTNISSVKLTEGMALGGTVFLGCNNLKEVTIPKGLVYNKNGEGNAARANKLFYDCKGLEKVILEEGATFAEGMFSNCTGITEVIIKSKTLESIPDSANNPFLKGSEAFTDQITFKVYKDTTAEATLKSFGIADEKIVYLTDFTALEEAISNAGKIDTNKYTEESVLALSRAVEDGKTVMENVDATNEEVEGAARLIEDAIKGLVKKPTEPAPTEPEPTKPDLSKPTTKIPTKPTATPKATRSPQAVKKDKTAAQKAMKQAKITKLKVKSKAKKKINVTWKKVKKAKGYQVQISAKKTFKKIIFKKDLKKTKLNIKNKKIKSKKTYFVRVRAYATYKNANNKTVKVYSKWNKQFRKVKVK